MSISAESKRESEENDDQEIVTERYYGGAYRSFTLPVDIDGERTEARYDQGVLSLALSKKVDGNARRITVSRAATAFSGRCVARYGLARGKGACASKPAAYVAPTCAGRLSGTAVLVPG